MTQAVVVSKQGVDVLTETNPNNLIFHSSYNTFKILQQGLATVTIGSVANSTTNIVHNLGTIYPFYAVANNSGVASGYMQTGGIYATNITIGTDLQIHGKFWSFDTTNNANTLTMSNFQNIQASQTVTMRYYIFARPI